MSLAIRHCERSEATQGLRHAALGCFVASLLAMTTEAMEVALVQKRLASLK
jgi:hypothetical protein